MMVILTPFLSRIYFLLLSLALLSACEKENPELSTDALSPTDEQTIGASIDQAFMSHIQNNAATNCLDRTQYQALYSYIEQKAKIIQHSAHYDFMASSYKGPSNPPIIRIIQEDGNTGAFISPGGHLYFYTDFLHSIEGEAQFMSVLAHLMSCSMHRFDIAKLEHKFSRNFLFDIALGANINRSGTDSGSDLSAVIRELEDHPYPEEHVSIADKEVEIMICNLNYNIRSYSDLYHRTNGTSIKWLSQFPRIMNAGAYATHLSTNVQNSVTCNGQIGEGDYSAFKLLLP